MDVAHLKVPDSVLEGARFVMAQAHDVSIHDDALGELAGTIEARLQQGVDDLETAFGTTGVLDRDVNIVFFETVVNFCFWGDLDGQKWTVERDGQKLGGWYSLAACFDRAIARGVPVDDAAFMTSLTEVQARELFAGVDDVEIPLLQQRVRNLNEAGRHLVEKYDGRVMKLLAAVDFSAPRLAEYVATELMSFRDGATYDGRWVWVLKRAQILGGDLSQLSARYPEFRIKDCDKLTAFADYRLPQILRHYEVITYSQDLGQRVDAGEYIEAASAPEIEIRAATIQVCELLKTQLPNRSSADIDVGLWLLSQDMHNDPGLSPHHRTLGQFY